MTKKLENYSLISEQELVERLIAVPVDEKLHDFFLRNYMPEPALLRQKRVSEYRDVKIIS